MHRVLPSPKRGFPGTEHPGIVWLIPTLTEHTHLRTVKASIAPTHPANKSCADHSTSLSLRSHHRGAGFFQAVVGFQCEREASTAVRDSSMMVIAISISLSVIESGGAMRKQLSIPPVERTIFMDRPRCRHSSPTATPSASAGSLVVR